MNLFELYDPRVGSLIDTKVGDLRYNYREFFPWWYDRIAEVEIKNPSMKEWIENAPAPILAITMDILWNVYRTRLVTNSQVDHSEYSKAVPAILHAYKRIGKWEYSDWFIEPELRLGMGRDLEFLAKLKLGEYSLDPNWISWFDKDKLNDIILKTCAGNIRLAFPNTIPVPGPDSGYSVGTWKDWSLMPREFWPMLFQIWVYHPAARCEEMILDPFDWDAVPEPVHTLPMVVDRPPTLAELEEWDRQKILATKLKKEKGGMFSKGFSKGRYIDI